MVSFDELLRTCKHLEVSHRSDAVSIKSDHIQFSVLVLHFAIRNSVVLRLFHTVFH